MIGPVNKCVPLLLLGDGTRPFPMLMPRFVCLIWVFIPTQVPIPPVPVSDISTSEQHYGHLTYFIRQPPSSLSCLRLLMIQPPTLPYRVLSRLFLLHCRPFLRTPHHLGPLAPNAAPVEGPQTHLSAHASFWLILNFTLCDAPAPSF